MKSGIFLVLLSTLAAVCMPREARCELLVTLEPQHAASNENVFIHVTSTTGPQCFSPDAVVEEAGNSLVLKLTVTDACGGNDYVAERRYLVGSFQEGFYTLDVEFCVLNPPPFPSGCHVISQLSFGVGGIAYVAAVPANSGYAITWLFMCIFLVSIAKLFVKEGGRSSSAGS